MATIAEGAPSTHIQPLQTVAAGIVRAFHGLEYWFEGERDQLPLWFPVALGVGIVAWFVLPGPPEWIAAMAGLGAIGLAALAAGRLDRASRVMAIGALTAAFGVGLIWWRASEVAVPVLTRPAIVMMTARVESVEPLPARELMRLRLSHAALIPDAAPADRPGREALRTSPGCENIAQSGSSGAGYRFDRRKDDCKQSSRYRRDPPVLPPNIRINIAQADFPEGLSVGAVIRLQARLMPPNEATVPGAYDFRRVAWFDGLGATGKGIAPITVVTPGRGSNGLRAALSAHIEAKLPGSAGGIASALATGDEGAISQQDSDAMRRSGLAHLLSVSGLHITATVMATIWAVTRILALFPGLALRVRVPVIAAGAGAFAAIGYTLLTGSQVPTMRSCVASLLVLTALAMGREAITLRLVAAGAFVVLLLWPEALMGPSFQLSFAAVAAIVTLHEQTKVKSWFQKRDEAFWRAATRELRSLLLTGVVVEAALAPIALYHFHKSGLFGAFANIVAIPLTTFVIMPAEALALVADAVGAGAPFWWVTDKALALLLWVAHAAADAPGSLAMLPAMPSGAYALMIAGGLWLALWRSAVRMAGLLPFAVGAIWALATPPPDILITGDGQHVAIRTPDGRVAVLRDRTGDYARDTLSENAGADGDALLLSEQPFATCSRDACLATVTSSGRSWRVLATRSPYQLPIEQLTAACSAVDIVVSDRRLPRTCTPRWLKLDSSVLRRTGGLAISLRDGRIVTVRQSGDRHPWVMAFSRTAATTRQGVPEHEPEQARNAEDHRRDWPDRAGS